MDEEQLRRVEDALAVYDRTHVNAAYPDGRDPISRDVSLLVAEVRRLRTALLTIADDTNDIATYWDICDLIGEQPPSPEPRPRPDVR